jgi:pimeloyl-ACP methyl ester carboxylesterase
MKKDIILLHGALGSADQLSALASILSKDFTVHQLEFSGHGGQPFQNAFNIDIFTNELQEYIEQLQLDTPFIFGYSMGGYVALNLSAHSPEMLGDIICLGTKFDWSMKSVQRETTLLDPKSIEENVPRFAEALRQRHQPNDWTELLSKTALLMEDLAKGSRLQSSEFAAIQSRVLLCRGTSDNMVTKEETEEAAQLINNATNKELQGVPHPIEKVPLDLLTGVIKDFLN